MRLRQSTISFQFPSLSVSRNIASSGKALAIAIPAATVANARPIPTVKYTRNTPALQGMVEMPWALRSSVSAGATVSPGSA
jgi:hypothetical protein